MAVTGTGMLGGRYLLAEVLGAGGMATVWRASDGILGREVAVKVLSPQFAADAGFLARFEEEARHAAALSHPRLVTVFDSGVDGTTPFIVMELVAGRTLRQVLDEAGMLSAGEAAAIACFASGDTVFQSRSSDPLLTTGAMSAGTCAATEGGTLLSTRSTGPSARPRRSRRRPTVTATRGAGS